MEEAPATDDRSHRVVRTIVAVVASLSLLGGLSAAAVATVTYRARTVGVDRTWFAIDAGGTTYAKGDCSRDPCNFLLLGSDSRAGLSADQQVQSGNNQDIGGTTRADTIMIVHTDPSTDHTVILSFPRDLWVDVPGVGMDKINSAFEGGIENGGPQLMTSTVQRLTGITIDHYLYVDLNGFQQAVDTLGGVDMCIPSYYVNTPGLLEAADPNDPTASITVRNTEVGHIVDPYTGLDVVPGCQHLDGVQALAYVRTRHNLPCSDIPDFARIGRQQQFMRALINQMLKPAEILKAPTLVVPVLSSLHRDFGFYPGDLIYLVGQMRGVSTGAVEFRSVSGTDRLIGTQDAVVMDPSAEKLFAAIRTNSPMPAVGTELPVVAPSEANTVVAVIDAGNPTGAGEVEDVLSHAGFDVGPGIVSGRVPKGVKGASIIYQPGQEDYARVARAYFPDLPMVESAELHDAPVAVIVPPGYHPSSGSGGGNGQPPAATQCPTPTA
jgi:anionic cell wall polymer biosynthesis LytR-Cps2A-Psr (LCP) family protein